MTILQTTIAGSLPKPAWLAEPDAAVGAVEARRRRARRRQARRGAPRAARPGARGHRHRHRRRADAPPFRHHVHRRRSTASTSSTRRPCASATATTPTCRWSSGAVARRHPVLRRRCRASCAARPRRHGQVHAARPDDDGRHALRRALRQPREAGAGRSPRSSTRRRARSRRPASTSIQFDEPAFNVYFDEVRDWGIAALERAAAGPALHDRRAHLLRLRHQGQQRLEEDAGQRMAAVRADVSAARAHRRSTRCRSNARTRTCRSTSSGCSTGKDVLVGAIDVATDRVETPEDVAATIRAALRFVPAERLYPCTNCGMVPLARDVARGKLAALGAGAALVRAELRQRRSAERRARPNPRRRDIRERLVARSCGELSLHPGSLMYTAARVLFQGSKARSVRPLRSRSTAVLSP